MTKSKHQCPRCSGNLKKLSGFEVCAQCGHRGQYTAAEDHKHYSSIDAHVEKFIGDMELEGLHE